MNKLADTDLDSYVEANYGQKMVLAIDLNIIKTLQHRMKKALKNNSQQVIPALKANIEEIWNSFTSQH